MKIKFGNVHKLRYKVLSTFLSLAVLFTGTGLWCNYVLNNDLNAEAAPSSLSSTYNVKTTLYDYRYDNELILGSQPDQGQDDLPYTIFNSAVDKQGYTVPLYFGNMYNTWNDNTGGGTINSSTSLRLGYNSETVSPLYWDANVANRAIPYDAVAQGIVSDTLSSDGVPMDKGSNKKLIFFDDAWINSSSNNAGDIMSSGDRNFSLPSSGYKRVYFDLNKAVSLTNSWDDNKWDKSTPHIYLWRANTSTNNGWPGKAMTADSRNSGWYYYDIPAGSSYNTCMITSNYYDSHKHATENIDLSKLSGGMAIKISGKSTGWDFSQDRGNMLVNAQIIGGTSNEKMIKKYPGLQLPFELEDGYYVFDSKTDPYYYNSGTDKIVKRSGGIMDNDPDSSIGFFPFNSSITASTNKYQLNYGFGAKFEIPFSIASNGKTYYDGSFVDTIFEFKGDDDLWLFIGDKLVLDMGGAHGAAHGTINFAADDGSGHLGTVTIGSVINNSGNYSSANNRATTSVLSNKTVGLYSLLGEELYNELYNGDTETIKIFYMERGMLASNCYIRFNTSVNNELRVSEQTDFGNVNTGLKALTQKVADNDVFKYNISNNLNNQDAEVSSNGYLYPTNKLVQRNNSSYSAEPKITDLSKNGSVVQAETTFTQENGDTPVANQNFKLYDPFVTDKDQKLVDYIGQTDSSGAFWLMYGERATFKSYFTKNSKMKVTVDPTLYKPSPTYSNNQITFDTTDRRLSDYYTSTVNVTDKEGGLIYNNIDLSTYQNDNNSTYDFKYADISLNDTESTVVMNQLFKNTVKTGSIRVTKALKNSTETPKSQNGAGNAQFTIKVELTDLFGVAGENVTDYGSIAVTGDHGKTLSDDGTYTLEKGESFTINGIPVGTRVTISELDSASGKYFDAAKAEITPNGLTEVEETQTGEYTVTNVRKTGKITINKEFADDSVDKTGKFTARVTFDTNDNPENIDLVNYNISYTDSTHSAPIQADLQSGSGSSYFEVTISDKADAVIENVPYGIKYKVEEVLTTDQTNAGWQTPTMTVGSANYNGSPQTFEGDAIYTITNNKQETVDIYVQKAFADLSGEVKTISEGEEIAATRTVTFKVYMPKGNEPDSVTYTYYTKGGTAHTKTVQKGIGDYQQSYETGIYALRYRITVPNISLSTTSTKLLTLPKIEGLTVVVTEDTTDNKWVPTYYDVTGTPVESDAVTFDVTTNQYNFKIVNKPDDVTDTYTLKVKKVIENGQTEDRTKPFKVNLKLKFSATANSDLLQLMEGYEFKYTAWIKQSSGLTKLNYKKDIPITVEWEEYDPAEGTMTCTLEGLNIQKQERYPYKNSNNYRDSEYRVDIPKAFAGLECKAELVSAYEDLDGSNEWLDPKYKYEWNDGVDESKDSTDGNLNCAIEDNEYNILTITNEKPEAYLTITKYIDSLHYGENDNAHNFAPGDIGIPDIDSTTKPEYTYDPFHYLQYTQAEQLFEFKITEYDLSGEEQHEYHVFLKFGPDSARLTDAVTYNENGIDYYYSQSKMFKVKPGYSYTVEEVGANSTQNTGISWRYKYDGNQVSTGSGVNYADGKCKYIGDRKTTTLESTFNFYNSRTEGSQTIESDQSSIINHIDYTGK